MTAKSIFFVLGIAAIACGVSRAVIVPSILKQQVDAMNAYIRTQADEYFETTNRDPSTDSWQIPEDLRRLEMRLRFSAGQYPGWPQAIVPVAIGLMFLSMGVYFGMKTKPKTEAEQPRHSSPDRTESK